MSNNPYAPILHTGYANTYSEETVEKFTDWCAKQGFSGFSMEGKSKAPTDEIDQWIETYLTSTAYGVKHAAKHGLDAWLFDEWGYPTGTAAGKTMKDHPEFQSKTLHLSMDLVLQPGQTVTLPVPEHFLAAAVWPTGRFGPAMPLPGTASEQLLPENGQITHTAKAVERLAVVTWEFVSTRTIGIFKNDPTKPEYGTLDLLSREAVAFFLTQMHERYVQPYEGHWGGSFKGFFYDEPFLSYPVPYTFDILDEFKMQKGYDLTPFLPEMMCSIGTMRADRVHLSDYRYVCTKRMAEAFIGQMADWCHSHGVELVGHQDLDHSARGLNTNSGNYFHNSAYSDAPGVDYIWNQIHCGDFCDYPRFAGSARRLLGKQHAISESFAATGRSLYPDQMRYAMEHQALRGIDRFYLMIVDPDPHEGGFFGPLSQGHPQSEIFGKMLNHRIAVTNRMLNEASPCAETAIYLPMQDIYLQNLLLTDPASTSLYPHIWDRVDAIAKALCYSQCDYDYIWDDAVLELPLEDGAFVTPKGQRIRTLLISQGTNLSEPISNRLNEFLSQGGKILSVGGQISALAGKLPLYATAKDAAAAVPHRITAETECAVSLTHRKSDDREYFFLLNEDRDSCQTVVHFPEEGFLSEYDFETEEFRAVEGYHPTLSFTPMQLRIFSITARKEALPALPSGGTAVSLTDWKLTLSDGSTVDAGDVLGDWRRWEDPCYSGILIYRTEFHLDKDCRIRLDLGKVCYAARIRVDGVEYPVPFAPFTKVLELAAGSHSLEVDVLNTGANDLIGTPERELVKGADSRASMYEHDRFRLESGLFGPVTYTVI